MSHLVEKAFAELNCHPFTVIQMSDREKFHTGLLKYALDEYEELYEIFGVEGEFTSKLEYKSVDLIIRKNKIPYIIVESKFKTHVHNSKVKNGESISQLQKYANNNHDAMYGFVISLFPEKNTFLKIKNHKYIDEYKNITFTNEILNILIKIKAVKNPLLKIWIDYLKNLKVIVDYVIESKLNSLFDNFELHSDQLKLSGLFENYRLNLLSNKINKESVNGKFKLFGRIDNTRGNALFHFEKKFDNPFDVNFNAYGIQWQTDKIKFYIILDNINSKPSNKKRIELLREIGVELQEKVLTIPKIKINEIINREGKFRSINIYKRTMFDEINDMPKIICDLLNYLHEINFKLKL